MNHSVFPATVAVLTLIALAVLLMALLFPPLSRSTAHAQANTPPRFTSEAITFTIDENTPPYQNIGTPVTATDPDNDTLTYSLGNASVSHFTIVRSTGQLLTGSSLNYETTSTYTVKVIATDPSDRSDSITVTITVNNVDEPGKVTLFWDQPQVGTPLEATLTDPDGAVSGQTWQWFRSNTKDGNYSNISGATSASYTPVANDAGKFLRATASYTDTEGSGKTAQMVSYRNVRVEPSNNGAPAFPAPEDISGGYACSGTDAERGVCLYVRRSAPVGSWIYQPARVEDPDDDEVRYSLEGDDATSFDINAATGEMSTKQLFRDVDTASYTVTIKAKDPSGASDTIKATISPSGSKKSLVVEGPDEIKYPENGTWRVAAYTAENSRGPTNGWIVSVEPGGGDGDFFYIDDDGVLTFETPPDYEAPRDDNKDNKYSFSITAYDPNPPNGGRPGQTFFNVKVIVTDVEELGISGPSTVDYPENGTGPVATYTIIGLKETGFTVSLTGEDRGDFSISNNGVLRFESPPDHEAPADSNGDNEYHVTIEASYGGDTKSLDVTVTVTEVNEPPAFPDVSGTRSIPENTGPGEPIGEAVTANDPEDDPLTYSLGGPDAGSFDIDESTGQLKTKAPLDHKTKSSYSVIVSVRDNKDTDGNFDTTTDDTITVTITVTNVNEVPEFPTSEAGARSVAENTAAGENIGAPVAAEDDDGDSLTYTLGGTDAESFDIEEESGQLQTKAPLDYETKSSYRVTVNATDPSDAPDTITVTITVTNEEEEGTVVLSSVQPQVDTQLTATLTDPDGGITGDTWTWGKSSDGSSNWAAISGATSASYTPVAGDVGDYLRVTASYTDGEGSGKTAQAVSDNPVRAAPVTNSAPEFDADTTTREVAENTPAGQAIGSPVTATDPDTGDSLTYTLGGTDAESFDIVASSGQLQTKAPLDYETKSSYTVTVNATDPSDASDTITVTITVTDLYEAPRQQQPPPPPSPPQNEDPEFPTSEAGARSVAENTAAGENIGDPVAAGDADNDPLTYTLGGDDAGSFDIVASSGQLQTRASLDYETKSSYSVTVSVRDNKDTDGNPDTATDDTVTVTITVTDLNEGQNQQSQTRSLPDQTSSRDAALKSNRRPVFTEGTDAERSVVELTAAGTNIGQPVTATDADRDTLTYSLRGTDAESFDIVASSGQLRTKAPLDHETKSSYTVTVIATDPSDNSGAIKVTITVTDVNEVPEFPTSEAGARSMAENTAAGENIGDPVAATDDDNDALTYALGGTDAGSFDIVASSGQLQTKASLDYETKNTYSLTVSVRDGKNADGNPDTATDDTITVTITVTNEEEEGTVALSSVQPQVDTQLTATLTDPDDDVSGTTWEWESSSDKSTWTVISGATSASYTPVAGDVGDYLRVTASYTDGESSGKTAQAVSANAVQAVPLTNSAPEFAAESVTREIAENTGTGENIGDPVVAEDDDNDALTYILGGTDAGSFDIVASSGQLQTKASLDYETKNTYSLTVSVRDGKNADGNPDTATDDTITVTIIVTNEEEEGTVALSSVQPQVDTQLTATLTDPDDDVSGTTWEWESSSDKSTWTVISGATSASYTPVAGDVGDYLRVTASYTDGESSGKTAQAVSANAVQAVPLTNSAPEFAAESVTREIAENTGTGENIGDPVVAEDDDNDALTYILGGTDAGSFDIVASSGQLQTKASLDYETKSSYTVTVTATDPSDASDSITVTIAVTDEDEGPVVPSISEMGFIGIGANPKGFSTSGFPSVDYSGILFLSNAKELTLNELQSTSIQTTSIGRLLALLISVIMMVVGASMIAVGIYLMIRLHWDQRLPRRQNRRSLYSPAFSPAPGVLP